MLEDSPSANKTVNTLGMSSGQPMRSVGFQLSGGFTNLSNQPNDNESKLKEQIEALSSGFMISNKF